MALEGCGWAFIISGIVTFGLCLVFVWVPIIGWVSHNCVDMGLVTMPFSENESGQVYCSLTTNLAESVRVQLQAPSTELFVMLVDDGSKLISNYSYGEYKSEDENVQANECTFILSIVHQEKDSPMKLIFESYQSMDYFLVDNQKTNSLSSRDYESDDFDTYESMSVFGIHATNTTKLWSYGGSYRYEIYACNPSSRTVKCYITVLQPQPGFNTAKASKIYSDVEDVLVPLSQNVSSDVEQHVIVQYKRIPGEPTQYNSNSLVLMDYNTSNKYKWATLGGYLGLIGLGVILILLGVAILVAPNFFVLHFGSNNLRNEVQPLNSKIKYSEVPEYTPY